MPGFRVGRIGASGDCSTAFAAPGLDKGAAASGKAKAAHSAPTGHSAPSPLSVSGELSAAQWEQLIARVGALPVPTVSTKPSSSAVADPLQPAPQASSPAP